MAGEDPNEPGLRAHAILRSARRGALATIEPDGTPHVSLVAVATDFSGRPLMMLSRLARHTRNLDKRAQVSLLLEDLVPGDPMANGRLSLSGSLAPVEDADARRRFLARQPGARFYADLGDFALYRLEIARGHLVAGFGRIADVLPAALVRAGAADTDVAAREAGIAEHMNADHRDAVADYARGLLGEEAGDWRFDGLDPLGCEIALAYRARYVFFDTPLTGARDARTALFGLAGRARAGMAATENVVGP